MNQNTNLKGIQSVSNGRANILYTEDSKSNIRAWACWVSNEAPHGIFYTDFLINGKIKTPVFKESKPMNVGKANETTVEQQAVLMLDQEIGKKLRSNYFYTEEEARSNKKWLPMLCPSGMKWREYAGTEKVFYPAFASNKLDGARINSFPGLLQTREGKVWHNFEHIKKALEKFHAENPTIILDGEGYNSEYYDKFQKLMSIFRKEKPTEEDRKLSAEIVQYHIYDLYDTAKPEMSTVDRLFLLERFYNGYFQDSNCIVLERSLVVHNEEEYDNFHNNAIANNYEGSILRLEGAYDVDKRSKYLLKRKEVFDCEFELVDVIEGEGTNAGIAAKVIIDLTKASGMNAEDKAKLTATQQYAGMARGWDHDACREFLLHKEKYLKCKITVEYFGITDDGKCRFPKFKSIRLND